MNFQVGHDVICVQHNLGGVKFGERYHIVEIEERICGNEDMIRFKDNRFIYFAESFIHVSDFVEHKINMRTLLLNLGISNFKAYGPH